MRYTVRLIVMLLFCASAASAQWRPSPYFWQYKGVWVDSLLKLGVNDTTMYPAASNPGAVIFRQQTGDTSFYGSNGARWNKIGSDIDLSAYMKYSDTAAMLSPYFRTADTTGKWKPLAWFPGISEVTDLSDTLATQTLHIVTNKGNFTTNKIRIGDSQSATHQLDVVGPTGAADNAGDGENGIMKIVGLNTNRSLFLGWDSVRNESWVQPRNGNDYGLNYNLRLMPNGGRLLIGRQRFLDTTTQSIRNLFIQTDESNTGTRIYVLPNGNPSGTNSAIKIFGTDYLSDIVNYDDFNIVNHDTSIWFNHKKNGTGLNKDMVFMFNDGEFKVLTIRNVTRNILVNGATDDAVLSVRSHTSEGVNPSLPIIKVNSGLNIRRFEVLNDASSRFYGAIGAATPLVTSGNATLSALHYSAIITNSSHVITLPAASSCVGRLYVLVNYNTGGNVTISSVNRDGAVTTSLPDNAKWTIQSDGTNWYVIQD